MSHAPENKKRILIVEDDEDFVFILEKKFILEGFSIIKAKDGQEGIDITKREKPDLILSDMLMPKIDGLAMAKKIREFNKSVPIIFLTNIKNEEYSPRMQKSHHFYYLIKADTNINQIVQKAKSKLGIK